MPTTRAGDQTTAEATAPRPPGTNQQPDHTETARLQVLLCDYEVMVEVPATVCQWHLSPTSSARRCPCCRTTHQPYPHRSVE